jgi:AraC-like DNA-binding protein
MHTTEPAFEAPTCVQLSPREHTRERSFSADLGGLLVHRQAFDHGIHLRSVSATSGNPIGFIAHRSARISQYGRAWSQHEIAVLRGTAVDLYTNGPSEFVWLESEPGVLPQLERRASARGLDPVLVRVPAPALSALRVACSRLNRESIVKAVVDAFRAADVRAATAKERAEYDFVRRAEDLMWQTIDEPMNLQKLAGALNCSQRKVLYTFHRVYGTGPMSFFKIERLNAAHAALRAGQHARTILDIAADYGFWHLGHFGSDYKALFGATPSQTRRAAAGA